MGGRLRHCARIPMRGYRTKILQNHWIQISLTIKMLKDFIMMDSMQSWMHLTPSHSQSLAHKTAFVPVCQRQ